MKAELAAALLSGLKAGFFATTRGLLEEALRVAIADCLVSPHRPHPRVVCLRLEISPSGPDQLGIDSEVFCSTRPARPAMPVIDPITPPSPN